MYISTNDYQGHVSLLIATHGCNLRCGYCHNPQLVNDRKPMSLIKIEDMINRNLDFMDAITVTGGEPLLHTGQLLSLFKFAKSKGLKIKLDTNGEFPKFLKDLVKYCDHVSIDVKTSKRKYKELTGANLYQKVMKCIDIVNAADNTILECRTTYSPEYMSLNDLEMLANDIKCDIFTLQQFRSGHNLNIRFHNMRTTPHDRMIEVAKRLKPYFNKIQIRTGEFGLETI